MEHEGITGVFEGGGVRGVAVAGAAAAALDAGIAFDRTIGTSAGALVGSLVAAGFTAAELSKTVCSVRWPDLLDPVRGASIPLIGKHLALVFRKGIFKGDRLERIWAELLAKKGVRVFGDLPAGAFSVIVTDLNHSRGLSLPEELPRYGIDPMTFPVARAIRMSAAIPFLFTPVPLYDTVRDETVLIADDAMALTTHLGSPTQALVSSGSVSSATIVSIPTRRSQDRPASPVPSSYPGYAPATACPGTSSPTPMRYTFQ